jgi:N-acetylneuraminic acid mutarotase
MTCTIRFRLTAGLPNLVALGLGLVGVWAIAPARSETSPPGAWVSKAPMPAIRNEVTATALDGKIYVLGGNIGGGAADLARNEEYDPMTDQWRLRWPLPRGANHMNAVTLNGKIYAIGGFADARHVNPVDGVFEYDPAANSWRTLAPLSGPRGSVAVAVVDGKVHAIGGRGPDFKPVSTHQVLDPASGRWSEAAPMPGRPHDHTATVAVDGKIHIIGGRFGEPTETTDMHLVYDPAANAWSTAAPLPAPRSSLAVAVYKGMILVVGGETDTKSLADNDGYDVKADRWIKLAPLPSPRHGIAAATVGNLAYFAGGAQGVGGNLTSDQLFAFSMP